MIIEVSVIPKSPRFLVFAKAGQVKVRLTSPPEKGEANAELVKELSRALGRPVRIVSGHTSRRKRLEVGATPDEWRAFMEKSAADK
jgi:uncharacterized protein (TIGR00251 family)